MAKGFWKRSKSLLKYFGFRIGSVLFVYPVRGKRKIQFHSSYRSVIYRHVLFGVPKLNCLKNGNWDADFPECRLRERNDISPIPGPAGIRPGTKNPSSVAPGRFPLDRETLLRRPILKAKLPNFNDNVPENASGRPIRRKKPIFNANSNFEADSNPRSPIRNEIPDSANVQSNTRIRADEPSSSIQNGWDKSTHQLNLGKI